MSELQAYVRALSVEQSEYEATLAHYNRLITYLSAGVWGKR